MVVVSVLVVVVAAMHTPVATVEVASSSSSAEVHAPGFEGLQQVCLVWERGGNSVFRFS